MTDYHQQQQHQPLVPTSTAAVCSESLQVMQADYAAYYHHQQPMTFATDPTAASTAVHYQQQQQQLTHFYHHHQEQSQAPPYLYYYPPPMCGPASLDPHSASVYGQNMAAASFPGFYPTGLPPPPPPQTQQPPQGAAPPMPPSLMQPLPIPTSIVGSCPCCSAQLQQTQPQPQQPPPQQQQQQQQLPESQQQQPQQQQVQRQQTPQQQQQQHQQLQLLQQPLQRQQSRSSSCDSAYRTVSTSDLASVAEIQPQQQQQQLSSQWRKQQPPQQQQQQQQQQLKRWKTGYLRNILYKTEMCRDVSQKGACPRGPACQFAHTNTELLSPRHHPLYKTALCFDYKNRGHCQRGDHCFHAHLQSELRPAPPAQLTAAVGGYSDGDSPSSLRLVPQQHRRESTPRSAASGPYKTLAARLQQQQPQTVCGTEKLAVHYNYNKHQKYTGSSPLCFDKSQAMSSSGMRSGY